MHAETLSVAATWCALYLKYIKLLIDISENRLIISLGKFWRTHLELVGSFQECFGGRKQVIKPHYFLFDVAFYKAKHFPPFLFNSFHVKASYLSKTFTQNLWSSYILDDKLGWEFLSFHGCNKIVAENAKYMWDTGCTIVVDISLKIGPSK